MGQSLNKGANIRKMVGLRSVQIERAKDQPKGDAALKAEWDRRTETIRRYKTDIVFHDEPELGAQRSNSLSSAVRDGVAHYSCKFIDAAGQVESYDFDGETDADAVVGSRRMLADRARDEVFELWRGSHRIYTHSKAGFVQATLHQDLAQNKSPLRPRWRDVAFAVLAMIGIGYAGWHQLFDGRGQAERAIAISPGLEITAGETGTPTTLGVEERTGLPSIKVLPAVSPTAGPGPSLALPRPQSESRPAASLGTESPSRQSKQRSSRRQRAPRRSLAPAVNPGSGSRCALPPRRGWR